MTQNNQQNRETLITEVTLVSETSIILRRKEVDLKNEAQNYGGIVVEEKETPDGVEIRIEFSQPELMQVWKNLLGIK